MAPWIAMPRAADIDTPDQIDDSYQWQLEVAVDDGAWIVETQSPG
jgi:hypothetical protein